MLYGCDGIWWKKCNGVPEFEGIKISQDAEACAKYLDLNNVRVKEHECNDLLVDEPGVIGAAGNSGFQALNLLVQFGVTRIALVGIDMHLANGTHWHGNHARGLNNPSIASMKRGREAFDMAAPLLRDLGVDVVNCSAASAVMAFPKMSIAAALDRWGI